MNWKEKCGNNEEVIQ